MMFVGMLAPPVDDELLPSLPLELPLPELPVSSLPLPLAVLVIVVGALLLVLRVVEFPLPPVEFAELVGPAEITLPVALG